MRPKKKRSENETRVQVPLQPRELSRLERRASKNGRGLGREAAIILTGELNRPATNT